MGDLSSRQCSTIEDHRPRFARTVDGLHETVDCSVIQKDSSVTLLLTNHTTPGHSIETENLHIRLDNAAEPIEARLQRIDEDHANAKRLWLDMGQPGDLAEKDLERLEKASQVVSEKQSLRYDDGSIFFRVSLPAHAVAAVTIDFKPRRTSR